jgi:hypothetical protein
LDTAGFDIRFWNFPEPFDYIRIDYEQHPQRDSLQIRLKKRADSREPFILKCDVFELKVESQQPKACRKRAKFVLREMED